MQTITSTELQSKIGKVMKAVQRGPITITSHGEPEAVMVSYDKFEMMRRAQIEGFKQFRSQISQEAIANGLTEEILADLLKDE